MVNMWGELQGKTQQSLKHRSAGLSSPGAHQPQLTHNDRSVTVATLALQHIPSAKPGRRNLEDLGTVQFIQKRAIMRDQQQSALGI